MHKPEAAFMRIMRIMRIIQIRNPALHIVWNAGLLWKKAAATYSPAGRSTIGADGLNFSVRNGKRWNPDAIATIITLTYLYSFSLAFSTSHTLPARAPLSSAQVSGY